MVDTHNVWVLGLGPHISSTTEEDAQKSAALYEHVIFFFADLSVET